MKMKLCLIACVILITCGLCACSASRENSSVDIQAYEITATVDLNDGGTHVEEYPLWTVENCNAFSNSNAPAIKSVVFNGEEFTGSYWYSVIELYNNYQSDYYEFPGGWFAVNSSTGELVSIVFYSIREGDKTSEQCLELATTLAKQYIDIGEYVVNTVPGEFVHSYTFTRYINGIETCSKLSVGISTSGDIVAFSHMMLDAFDTSDSGKLDTQVSNVELATTAIEERSSDIMAKKISTIYPENERYVISKKLLVILESGKPGIVYFVDVDLPEIQQGDEIYHRTVQTHILLTQSET